MTPVVGTESPERSASPDDYGTLLTRMYEAKEASARSVIRTLSLCTQAMSDPALGLRYRSLGLRYRELADTCRARFYRARALRVAEELEFNRASQSRDGATSVKEEEEDVKPDVSFGFVDVDGARPLSEVCPAPSADVDPLALTNTFVPVVKQEPPEYPP